MSTPLHFNVLEHLASLNTLHPATSKGKEAAYNLLVRPKPEYGTVEWNTHTE